MYMQIQNATVIAIKSTQFIACSYDEVTTIDNESWICVHAYIVDCWITLPI
jgi:hypothetical protein